MASIKSFQTSFPIYSSSSATSFRPQSMGTHSKALQWISCQERKHLPSEYTEQNVEVILLKLSRNKTNRFSSYMAFWAHMDLYQVDKEPQGCLSRL